METIQRTRSQPSRHAPEDAGATDGELLEQFIRRQDESAFDELVRRHGPMVLGVCQRVLHNAHDAEDCFQAAFMVLVRKATSIQPPAMVGNWLYGVAYRTALEARKMAARRRVIERKQPPAVPTEPAPDRWQELRPVLDQELSRLPDKYRVVLIACDLQGKTRQQTAHQLRLPEGTVASRLARARAMLAKRLNRHNVELSAVTLPLLLPDVPPSLTASTVAAAARLAAGKTLAGSVSSNVALLTDCVVKALFLSKLKFAAAALVVLAVLGFGLVAFLPPSVNAERKADVQKPAAEPRKVKPERVIGYIVQDVDLASQTIEATRPDSFGSDESTYLGLRVEPSTKIIIDGHDGKLADLKSGHVVNLEFERSATGIHRALRIEATGDSVGGFVLFMDEANDTVTIQNDALEKTTFNVEKSAPVYIDGKKAKAADLKAKMRVTVQKSFTKPGAVSIDAGPRVVGVVKAVHPEKKTIAVDIPSMGMVAEGLSVADDAPVYVDGKKGKLADVPPGSRGSLQLSAEPQRDCVVGIRTTGGAKK